MLHVKQYLPMSDTEIKKVKQLRQRLAQIVPARHVDNNLLLASFNIRELGVKARENFAVNALSEICCRFDIIAIQELRHNLSDLERMLGVMGPWWKVLFNDPAAPLRKHSKKGNDERFAFIYDARTVHFSGMAAELLITDDFLPNPKAESDKEKASMPWRTPYMASFRAGFFDFMLLTVHVQWNEKAASQLAPRRFHKSSNGSRLGTNTHGSTTRTCLCWATSTYPHLAARHSKR